MWEVLHANPFYVDLLDSPAPSLDFTDIEQKYRKMGQKMPICLVVGCDPLLMLAGSAIQIAGYTWMFIVIAMIIGKSLFWTALIAKAPMPGTRKMPSTKIEPSTR